MREAMFLRLRVRTQDLPHAVLVEAQAVVGASPYTVAVYQNAEDVIIGKTIGGGEVLPAEHRHVLGDRQGCGDKQRQCEPRFRLHNVFRYSIRSFNSSLVRSLVRPYVSLGL